jgi:hypothetical protein
MTSLLCVDFMNAVQKKKKNAYIYEGVSKSFRTASITKINTR